MSDHKPTTGPGSVNDPNQADKTGLPGQTETPKVDLDVIEEDEVEGPTGPGTTVDPNQADRT